MKRGSRTDSSDPPMGLRATRLAVGDEELVVFSFPVLPPELDALPPGEREVAVLVLGGLSNAEVAERRGTTARTVGKQLDAIYSKLGVRGRRELAALAAKALSSSD